MACIPYTYTLPSLGRVSSERRVFPPETLVIPPLPPLQTFEKKRKKNPPRLFRLPLYSPPSSRALIHLPPRFIAFVFVPSPIPLRPGTLNAMKRATSSSRCLRCGAGGPSFVDGIAKRCRDTLGERGMEGRGEEGVESRWRGGVGERGRERWKRGHRGWWTGVGENVGRRTLLPTAYPGLPHLLLSLLHLLSKRGARARSPSTLRKQLLSFDSILQGTMWGIPIHDDNRYLNRRFRFI